MTDIDKIRAELPGYGYNDYLRLMPALESELKEGKPLRIAVLGSYTIAPIEPVLEFRLRLEGFNTEIFFGGYDQYTQEILDESSALYEFNPQIVLLMTRVADVMPDFVETFGESSAEQWRTVVEAKADDFIGLITTLQERQSTAVLVQNFTTPERPYWGIFDAQLAQGQSRLVGHFNEKLASGLEGLSGAYIWDFDRFVRRKGYDAICDEKLWYLAKSPYRQAILPELAADLLPYLLSILGRLKKCIVLDLDNTLWGGVVGEDGLEGIALGHTYPGLCYRDFQKELLKLQRRGLLLAINSKNNEADALEVLDTHPDMLLKRTHFAAMQINWNDKASNLHALAETLNIGLESFVMIDDNPVECEQIRQAVPECDVVCLPKEPYLIPRVVGSLPGIENIQLTDEDKKKGTMYQAQAIRAAHARTFADLDEFLRSLELRVEIRPVERYSVPRIAQLTQKTNQMNLTTRRYTEADISEMASDPTRAVFSIAARDRFGDNGIIGVLILELGTSACRIDTFLLSCRVIGRKIEEAMISFAADFATGQGMETLIGEFIPTAKNSPAAGMYEKLGFERVTDAEFMAKLGKQTFSVPDVLQLDIARGAEETSSQTA